MNNADYWKQRFTQLETAQHRKGATAYLEMERQYKEAQRQLEGQIARWYQRFADNNGISLAQAKQWLKGDDLAEFKWDVKAYIQHGKENAINGAWMQELENASAKYHISKLEALKIQTQNSYLFYGTIAENLRMCKPDATQEELENAAKAANCHDFISALPDGYNTIVGERGATLSGGERQRIAIARAVLKDAPFLILDEATSSVDAASEREIQQALDRLMENRTTMIIAHRLSTVKNADKIYVLENGFAVEEGSHDELIHKNGVYRRLVEAQAASGGEKL